jgi:ribosomal-protein-alanine N-acetyltransferase
MTNVKLASMKESHIAEILEIETSVFDTPWTAEMFRQEVRGTFGSHATVAQVGGHVVAYQIAWFIEDEVHLVNIAVTKRCQERGIATLLLNYLIDEALSRNKLIITLEVRAGNAVAQAFYHRFLFRTIGVRKGYYSDNREDALLMALDLTDYSHRRGVGEGKSGAR